MPAHPRPAFLALLAITCAAAQDPGLLPETLVTAERRLPDDRSIATWSDDEITSFAPRTIDELLATEPSFSLYRRQNSVFGNPASAGVSLRNTGATAVSRTLVLRDGIPQNDPFGGWVQWARFDPATLASARIVPAAGAGAWGNMSPAGIIQLTSREPTESRSRLDLGGGSHGTCGFSSSNDLVGGDGRLALRANLFGLHSDGFHAVAPEQRGLIDRPLDITTGGAELRAVWRPGHDLRVEPAVSFYDERRGNGTPLSRNSTEAFDASLRVSGGGTGLQWEALAYYQRRRFTSFFSSVNATRSGEQPALDQFDVPGSGIGGGFTATWSPAGPLTVVAGIDLRQLDGATNEDTGFVAGNYLRRRQAGGEQILTGLFARAGYDASAATRLDGSARVDFWSLGDGRRLEVSPVTGLPLRTDFFPDRDGVEPGLALAIRHRACDSLEFDASAGTSFRLPTIGELYRPYRVRNDITEANSLLDPERFFSLETGVAWTPGDRFSLELELFHHWVNDAIANVPVTDPAEAAAIAGLAPAGGTVSQRRNVDEARIRGAETKARWRPDERVELRLTWLYSHTEFTESSRQPLLDGRPFPQAPEHRVVAGIDLRPDHRWQLFADLEYGACQFDDPLATRRLGSWWTTRLGASWLASDHLTLHARIENLFDQEITTGLSSSGLRSIGAPRTFWVGAKTTW